MTRQRITGGAMLLLGVAALILTARIDYTAMSHDPGPRLFPTFAAGLLALCGLGILLRPAPHAETAMFTPEGRRRLLGMAGSLAVCGLLLWIAGFDIATPIMLLLLHWQLSTEGNFRLWRGIAFAVIGSVGLQVFFNTLLGAYLPPGWFN